MLALSSNLVEAETVLRHVQGSLHGEFGWLMGPTGLAEIRCQPEHSATPGW